MNKFIPRDYSRTEHDDFVLNVQDRLDKYTGAIAVFDSSGLIVGWQIKSIYE